MKKIILLVFLGLFIFCNCSRSRPEIEPKKTDKPVETFEEKDEAEKVKKEGETGDKEMETVEKVDVEPIKKEEIPIIKPVKPEIEIEISITDVFKGFGYSGDISVPGSFEKRVDHYVQYFLENEKGYRFFARAFKRCQQYLPMIQKILENKQLPEFLAYLPFIESGYNPNARSRVGAVGMWQFMRGTARIYGLNITRRGDDRKDPVKSTYAAAEYLNDLLSMFGLEDPFLGICAYNAGEGKILKALRKISYKERSFWTLVKKGLLRNETNEYIPRLIAIALIINNPQKYGFKTDLPPLAEDEAEDQEVIASLHSTKDDLQDEPRVEIDLEEVQEKPEDETARPETKEVEKGVSPAIEKDVLPRLKKETPNYIIYKVKRRDTLYGIAKKYNVKVKSLKKWNGLRYSRIYPGQKLKIYGQTPEPAKTTTIAKIESRGCKLVYTVNYTDSLARIALFFANVSARDIMHWNGLRRTRIYPRQKLTLYLKEPPRKIKTHVVKRGETATQIAAKYGIRLEYLLSLNGLLTDTRLKPGRKLKIYYF
jgi:membrane-bound lytic murein transglycosylase D